MKTERFSLLLVIRRAIGGAYDKAELWVYAKGFALMLAIFLCLPKRQRMSHNNGIAATGTLRIVDDPRFPGHAFFAPGKVYPCRIRHASVTSSASRSVSTSASRSMTSGQPSYPGVVKNSRGSPRSRACFSASSPTYSTAISVRMTRGLPSVRSG